MREEGGEAWSRRERLLRVVAAVLIGSVLLQCGAHAEDPIRLAVLRTVASTDTGLSAFLAELDRHGYRQGSELAVSGGDTVHSDVNLAQVQAAEWKQEGVDLILALSSQAARGAAMGAPDTNILFLSNDPVALGLVNDERRPCGRLTGATFRIPADRTLDLIRRALPGAEPMGVVAPADDAAALPVVGQLEEAAGKLGIGLLVETYSGPEQAGAAVASLARRGARVLLPANSPSTVLAFPQIQVAAAEAGFPVITNTAADFALAVLEPDIDELYRQLARQAVRLLGGERPCNVPVEDPAEYRLTVNLEAAADLGISVPAGLVSDADVVIGRGEEPAVSGSPG